LRELSAKKKYGFYLSNSGLKQKVLFESLKDDGSIFGFTDNYIKVKVWGNKEFENNIIAVKLSEPEGSKYCTAEVINN
jgi:threonylcarbamoyladenosine tRNA methylthiotransferase MtaB